MTSLSKNAMVRNRRTPMQFGIQPFVMGDVAIMPWLVISGAKPKPALNAFACH